MTDPILEQSCEDAVNAMTEMTDTTPEQARSWATLMRANDKYEVAAHLESLADQVDRLTAQVAEWNKAVPKSDWEKLTAERDALAKDAARLREAAEALLSERLPYLGVVGMSA